MSAVERRIREVLRDAGAQGWIHATRLAATTPREIGIGADELVVSASVYKVPLLVALCRKFDQGAIDPRATVRIDPPACSPGPTGTSTFLDPVTLSWRDLAASMIGVSDNAAADVILGQVGLDTVLGTLAELDLPRTRLVGGMADAEAALIRDTGTTTGAEAFAVLSDNDDTTTVRAYNPAYTSATTPREMTRLLDLIWSDAVASAPQCAFIRRVMGNQIWPHRIRAGFPFTGVRVSGKTGTVGAVRNEVAVVEFDGEAPVAVAIFTRAARADGFLPKVDSAIAECARLAVTDLRSGRL